MLDLNSIDRSIDHPGQLHALWSSSVAAVDLAAAFLAPSSEQQLLDPSPGVCAHLTDSFQSWFPWVASRKATSTTLLSSCWRCWSRRAAGIHEVHASEIWCGVADHGRRLRDVLHNMMMAWNCCSARFPVSCPHGRHILATRLLHHLHLRKARHDLVLPLPMTQLDFIRSSSRWQLILLYSSSSRAWWWSHRVRVQLDQIGIC